MANPEIKISVGVTGAKKASSDINKFKNDVTSSMTASEKSVASSIGRMVAQYASLAAAIGTVKKIVSTGMDFNKFFESTTTSFTVMMKSAEGAKKQIKALHDFAIESPLTFRETAESSKQLMAYGFAAKELVPTMEMLGSVAMATGKPLSDISYVYGTLRSQGRAYSRDLMQFGMRGIPIYEELSKVMGKPVNELKKLTEQGKIGFNEVQQAFRNMTTEGGRFYGILDGYMGNVEGKLAMLTGLWEQSAGSMTKGIFNSFKSFIDGLINTLKDSRMQEFIASLSEDLGIIASAVLSMVSGLIKIVPIMTKFLKVWLLFIATKAIFASINFILVALPEILFASAGAMATLSTSTVIAAGGMSNLAAAASLFVGALSPVIAIFAGIMAAVGLTTKAIKNAVRDAKMMKDEAMFEEQILSWNIGSGPTGAAIQDDWLRGKEIEHIKMVAKQYGYTSEKVAEILYLNHKISREVATQLGFNVDNWVQQQKIAAEIERTNKALSSRKFGSTLAAVGLDIKDWDTYVDAVTADLLKMGKAVPENISKMMEPDLKWKTEGILGNLDSMDIVEQMVAAGASKTTIDSATKDILTSRLGQLQGYFKDLINRDLINPDDENPQLKKWLANQIAMLEEQMENLGGGGGGDTKLSILEKWWLPSESAVAATITTLDDIALAGEKAMFNADKEADARKVIINSMTNEIIKAELLNELERDRIQIKEDIAKKTEREIELAQRQEDIAKFQAKLSGDPEYWDKMKASASTGNKGAAMGATMITALEGTEVGSMMGGSNPVTMLVAKLAEMLVAVENVNKVLNPIGTVLESMFSIIEPFINSVFQPISATLEMFGEVLGKILTPFLSFFQIIVAMIYGALLPLQNILQLVGAAFAWFNDYVMYPIGNALIRSINGVIKALNEIPFVNIRYIDEIHKVSDALGGLSARLGHMKDSLGTTISYFEKKINDIVKGELTSLQELYEVGAITGAEYETQSKDLVDQMINTDDLLVSNTDKMVTGSDNMLLRLGELAAAQEIIADGNLTEGQITTLLEDLGMSSESRETLYAKAIKTAIKNSGLSESKETLYVRAIETAIKNSGLVGETATIPTYTPPPRETNWLGQAVYAVSGAAEAVGNVVSSGVKNVGKFFGNLFGRDVGSYSIPEDGPAYIHKGEGIVPATFMDGIRKGEISLSGGKGSSSGSNINVVVNVYGSVQTEKDLAKTIANQIYTQRSRGLLTV